MLRRGACVGNLLNRGALSRPSFHNRNAERIRARYGRFIGGAKLARLCESFKKEANDISFGSGNIQVAVLLQFRQSLAHHRPGGVMFIRTVWMFWHRYSLFLFFGPPGQIWIPWKSISRIFLPPLFETSQWSLCKRSIFQVRPWGSRNPWVPFSFTQCSPYPGGRWRGAMLRCIQG